MFPLWYWDFLHVSTMILRLSSCFHYGIEIFSLFPYLVSRFWNWWDSKCEPFQKTYHHSHFVLEFTLIKFCFLSCIFILFLVFDSPLYTIIISVWELSSDLWLIDRFCLTSVLLICLDFSCCPIMCLYVLSSVLSCPLRFPHRNDVRFVFTSSCL